MLNRRLMNKCLHNEPYKLSDFYSHHLQQAQLVAQDVHHDQPALVGHVEPAQMALEEVQPTQPLVDQQDVQQAHLVARDVHHGQPPEMVLLEVNTVQMMVCHAVQPEDQEEVQSVQVMAQDDLHQHKVVIVNTGLGL